MSDSGERTLDAALDTLQKESPDRLCRAIRWLRKPEARRVRLPLGLLFVTLSFLWFLPVVGIEFLPLGLLLIAIDVPFLQKPVGKATLWMERQWLRLKAWWRFRRHRGDRPGAVHSHQGER